MSLNSALSIAAGGLANINAQFALISQNVANAATPGYAVETSNQQALTADGVGMGVLTGPATLQIDQALQSSVVAAERHGQPACRPPRQRCRRSTACSARPAQGSDIGSLLGNLQDSFSTLLTDPSNQTQQSAVVASATTLAQGINTLSDGVCDAAPGGAERSAVGGHHAEFDTGDDRPAQQPDHRPAADQPEHRRSAKPAERGGADVVATAAIKTVAQPNGDLSIFTTSGLTLPTNDGATAVLDGELVDIRRGLPIPAAASPAITLGGADVTAQMTGGQIGADITLRDTTLPTDQAELDEFCPRPVQPVRRARG